MLLSSWQGWQNMNLTITPQTALQKKQIWIMATGCLNFWTWAVIPSFQMVPDGVIVPKTDLCLRFPLHSDQCNPNPCLNGGVCSVGPNGKFVCSCPELYSGKKCQRGLTLTCNISDKQPLLLDFHSSLSVVPVLSGVHSKKLPVIKLKYILVIKTYTYQLKMTLGLFVI